MKKFLSYTDAPFTEAILEYLDGDCLLGEALYQLHYIYDRHNEAADIAKARWQVEVKHGGSITEPILHALYLRKDSRRQVAAIALEEGLEFCRSI